MFGWYNVNLAQVALPEAWEKVKLCAEEPAPPGPLPFFGYITLRNPGLLGLRGCLRGFSRLWLGFQLVDALGKLESCTDVPLPIQETLHPLGIEL